MQLILYLFYIILIMLRQFVIKNINLVSIILFLIFFLVVMLTKPPFIFDKNGKPREFGIGYRNKTVIPLWLTVIILAIFSYLIIVYYINFDKLVF
jgi:hypothetical protein